MTRRLDGFWYRTSIFLPSFFSIDFRSVLIVHFAFAIAMGMGNIYEERLVASRMRETLEIEKVRGHPRFRANAVEWF